MKLVSSFAVAASLIAGSMAATPVLAQKKKAAEQPAEAAGWKPKFSKDEAKLLQPIEAMINAKDWAGATAALAAAEPSLTSPDARYYVGQFRFEIGTGSNNAQLQAQGVDAMIASGGGDPARQLPLYRTQGALAMAAKDFAKAEASYAKAAQLSPNDSQLQASIAELAFLQKKPQEALPVMERAIAARKAEGQPVPENWYQLAIQSALNAKLVPQAQTLSKTLLAQYPTAKNWGTVLLIHRQAAGTTMDTAARLDVLRLMRATKSLNSGNDYLALADLLTRGNFYAEAKNVIEEGYSSGKLARGNSDATAIVNEVSGKIAGDLAALPGLEGRANSAADGQFALRLAEGYYGHGDYAKAAQLYRLALQKGKVDAGLVNSRLGMALVQAGQRAEAEAAFKAVTGPRADLANLWLAWLSQQA